MVQLRKHVLQLFDLFLCSSRSRWNNPVRLRNGSIWNQHDWNIRSLGSDGSGSGQEEVVPHRSGLFGNDSFRHGILRFGESFEPGCDGFGYRIVDVGLGYCLPALSRVSLLSLSSSRSFKKERGNNMRQVEADADDCF